MRLVILLFFTFSLTAHSQAADMICISSANYEPQHVFKVQQINKYEALVSYAPYQKGSEFPPKKFQLMHGCNPAEYSVTGGYSTDQEFYAGCGDEGLKGTLVVTRPVYSENYYGFILFEEANLNIAAGTELSLSCDWYF